MRLDESVPSPPGGIDRRDRPRAGHPGVGRGQAILPRVAASRGDPGRDARRAGGLLKWPRTAPNGSSCSIDSGRSSPRGTAAASVPRCRSTSTAIRSSPTRSASSSRPWSRWSRSRTIAQEVTEPPAPGPLPLAGAAGRLPDHPRDRPRRHGRRLRGRAGLARPARRAQGPAPPAPGRTPGRKQRFEREARAAAKLHHTNIVPVFGVGEHEGLPYYVMQFIQGLGLDAVLEELKRLQPEASGGELPRGCSRRRAARLAPGGHRGRRSPGRLRGRRRALAADRPVHDARRTATATVRGVDGRPRPTIAATGTGAGRRTTRCHRPAAGAARPIRSPLSSSSMVLPGERLRTTIRQEAADTYWQSVARIGVQVADALEYAHKPGHPPPRHQAVEPAARHRAAPSGSPTSAWPRPTTSENLTHTGDILGTLRYMPPEAFDGQDRRPRRRLLAGPDALRAAGAAAGLRREGPATG